jgi:hypothetical protein
MFHAVDSNMLPEAPGSSAASQVTPEAALISSLRQLYEENARTRADQDRTTEAILARISAMNFQTPTTTSTSNPSSAKPIFKEPSVFTGESSQVESFVSDIRRAIKLQRNSLTTEEDKCNVFGTYLADGPPKDWFRAQEKLNPTLLENFDSFITTFTSHFGSSNLVYEYTLKLEALRQSTTASHYASEFKTMAAYVNWTDETKINRFYQGLKPSTKDLISTVVRSQRPTTFDDYVKFAIERDNQAQERELEKLLEAQGLTYSNLSLPIPTSSTSSSAPFQSNGVPMEIDTLKTRSHAPLSDAEKKHRRELGLCLYCGNPGHGIANCPNMSPAARKRYLERQSSSSSTPS